ncbi:NAD(P)/FAD-dependent oxidoreductase [Homoserinibacter sp. GY 40078]|uniref:phytoene desaturase family protein n=1 Tax=Homoserinibacter sp. GY 40078 TaxID=2603275 RepID=UPI0011C96C5B|nr:NAD(P)/FAD-dependent oxidoreductase [Homoserinibacter sp. GY 40078]TXK16249.1 NAD(P)/FAD-dependent oxidoreductase [Homoserinibacter sp. GY 40078]
MPQFDAIVVGSGPNGLAAAVTLARAGLSVRVYERNPTIGGGARTAEVTLPGFHHDICSAVHPAALASPFFRAWGLREKVDFVIPEISYAQAMHDGRAGVAYHDLERTVEGLGRDGAAWRSLMKPLVDHIDGVTDFTGSQLLRIPRDPVTALRFGLRVLEQGTPAWGLRFREDVAPALLAGVNAHSIGRMPRLSTAGAGLMLAAHGHARGWPIPRGGSQAIIDALASDLVAHGGEIVVDHEVDSLDSLPTARAVLLDVTPRALDRIAGDRLPDRYRRALGRFRYGDAVAKVDFALSAPVPWTNPALAEAGSIHAGGTRAEIQAAEGAVADGRHPENPYLLISQPSRVDPTRAPDGRHVLWAYTHVPAGSTEDPAEAVINRIERFAPGFREVILDHRAVSASELEAYNPNYVGGDISAGAVTIPQLIRRPVLSTDPWRTPARGIYLSSSSTPPGTAVHGMCGWYAARSALRHEFGITQMPELGD